MAGAHEISVRFHEPPDDLARFFTTFCRAEFAVHEGHITDSLQPEWGSIRFFRGDRPAASIADGQRVEGADVVGSGPTSKLINFEIGSTVFWGIGLLPLGWATFMDTPANALANRIADARQTPEFAHMTDLANDLSMDPADEQSDLASIVEFFRAAAASREPGDPRILAIHQTLLDPALPDVAGMAERTGINPRTLERICRRAFGFGPKKLLRRQRFMRSVSQFMLDPELSWIGAIDSLYFDQSHFVRDCREFLGMSPSEYAAQDHPVLTAFMQERMKTHGSAVQTLDPPK